MARLKGMRLLGPSLSLLSLIAVTACGNAPVASALPADAAGGTGGEAPVVSDGTPALVAREGGTQTGGEGDQIDCGEGPPRWEPVDESVPLLGTYRGSLVTASRRSVLAELTLSNPSAVVALRVDSPPYHPSCLDGRRADVDWSLRVDGVLTDSTHDSLGYDVVERTGELYDSPELDELALEVTPPVPQAFRDLGMPSAYSDDARLSPDRVTVNVYVGLGYPRAIVDVQWRCNNCGSNRVGLELLEGNLDRVAE